MKKLTKFKKTTFKNIFKMNQFGYYYKFKNEWKENSCPSLKKEISEEI